MPLQDIRATAAVRLAFIGESGAYHEFHGEQKGHLVESDVPGHGWDGVFPEDRSRFDARDHALRSWQCSLDWRPRKCMMVLSLYYC